MNKPLFFVFYFALSILRLTSQIVNYPVQNFSPKEYGKNYNSQNFCVLEDKSGYIYFGNGNGILQYDGKLWQFIPVKNGAYVSSMAVDFEGTIFVGTQHEFGYLKANGFGQLIYHSLSTSLKGTDNVFGAIIKTYALNNEVIFQSQEKLFIYKKDNSLKVITPHTTFHTSFVVNNEFYIRERKTGLLKLQGDSLKKIKGGELFADIGIFSMLPFNSNGDILVATPDMGLWKFSPKSTNEKEILLPVKTSNEDLILSSGLYGGTIMSDGNFAFNTLKEGILIMDHNGQINSMINKEQGLRVNDVKQIIEDSQQNLWLSLNNGISKVAYNSHLSYYSDESGLTGTVHAIDKEGTSLFVATSNGLFCQQNSSMLSDNYLKVSGINNQIWSLYKTKEGLLAGGDDGIYLINNLKSTKVSSFKCRAVNYDSIHKAWLIGNEQGIGLLDTKWRLIKNISEINTEIISIKLNKYRENNSVDVWAGTSQQGIFHITIDSKINTNSKWIGFPEGLSNECIYPFEMEDHIVFGSSSGVYSYSEKEGYKLVPLLDGLVFDQKVSALYQFHKNLWLSINNRPVLFDRENKSVSQTPFLSIDKGQIHCFYQDSNVCWMGADDGLIRYDLSKKRDYLKPFQLHIRKVNCGKDSLIYYGNETYEKNKGKLEFHLTYDLNSIYFEYSALFFEDESKNLYSFKLEGQDTSWSNWTNETKAVFTNLREGHYTFRVKAKNIYGALSNEDIYSFTVIPPWYRTWWAYATYLLVFGFGIYAFIKGRTKKLTKEKEQLEKIVVERTAEISHQKDEIESKKHLIEEKHKEITDSINYAERIQRSFLATKQLLDNNLKDYFVFFQPKDVVSGDFYWATKLKNNHFVLVTADSTGHGVPGAIMSILNISCLENAIRENLTEPCEILNHTRINIIERLKKDGSAEGGKDGMDASLISFDFKKLQLTYAAANNPIWIVRGGQIIELVPDKMPVGKHDKDSVPFIQHNISLQKDDIVYALTDGMPDQFGGPKAKKFMYKQLKELLISISHLSMYEQKEMLKNTFNIWKGDLEQVDDVCVIGVRV